MPPLDFVRVPRRRLFILVPPALTVLLAAACEKLPASCGDVSGLTEDEAALRKTMGYSDLAPSADKRCVTCRHYVAASSQSSCGSCKLLKGPIHPNGYCQAYTSL